MKTNVLTVLFSAAVLISGGGCASLHGRVHEMNVQTRVAAGVKIVKIEPYTGNGQVAIYAQATQAAVAGHAQWWVESPHLLSSVGVFDPGSYTLHFGKCSDATYTPLAAGKLLDFPTPNKMYTVAVTYKHP